MSHATPQMRTRLIILSVGLLATGALAWALVPDGPAGGGPAVNTALESAIAGGFEGADAQRPQLKIGLLPVAQGLEQITDIQQVPGEPYLLAVLLKNGKAVTVALPTPEMKPVLPKKAFDIKVETRSEQGLLGLAFHPKYTENRLFYLHTSVATAEGQAGRIAEWVGPFGPEARQNRVLLEVNQPFVNHDGGQIAFGPDGLLYIGLGDGGAANDPQGNGQNPDTLLGAMLRIDVRPGADGAPYQIPADNPFVGQAGHRPEIFAWGLRNPWRFSFAPDGRLVAGDVGQNRFEEITFVGKGQNLGWNLREADRCFNARPKDQPAVPCDDGAPAPGLHDPIYAYPRADGVSVTGGYVYTGDEVPALKGRYVFGDFASGRLWAIDLPGLGATPRAAATKASALGKFDIQISTFGTDHLRRLYVGDFGGGVLYRVVMAP